MFHTDASSKLLGLEVVDLQKKCIRNTMEIGEISSLRRGVYSCKRNPQDLDRGRTSVFRCLSHLGLISVLSLIFRNGPNTLLAISGIFQISIVFMEILGSVISSFSQLMYLSSNGFGYSLSNHSSCFHLFVVNCTHFDLRV